MTRIIEDFTGKKREVECIGCTCAELGKDTPGYILETELFHIHQDQEVPIPGFVILSTKRHIESVADFTDEEIKEFGELLRKIRMAQREVLDIEKVYLVQEEDTRDHFHMWMLPRYEWMLDEAKFGKKVSSARPILTYARENMKTPENITAVQEAAEKLRKFLNE
ncbi:MAG: diadenosine tetraphosphate hydrolase [Candidatus Moraniibacteriota bacterium]